MSGSVVDTLKHIELVRNFLNKIIVELLRRAEEHDQCKLGSPEVELFDEFTPKLKNTTYGSKEYMEYLAALKPALDHHYACSRHHPEHFKDGIEGMNLVDLIEMFVDWRAASTRHFDGDIMKSIEINTKRFGISSQLVKILKNSMKLFE